MLNNNCKIILKELSNLCVKGYKVIEFSEIKQIFSNQIEISEIKKCITTLEKEGYILIKYMDEKVVCLTVLVTARQLLKEQEEFNIKKRNIKRCLIWLHFTIFLASFLASLLALVVFKFII